MCPVYPVADREPVASADSDLIAPSFFGKLSNAADLWKGSQGVCVSGDRPRVRSIGRIAI